MTSISGSDGHVTGHARDLAPTQWRRVLSSRWNSAFQGRTGLAIDVALAIWCVLMLAAMAVLPGGETIPYHLIFLALTLVYGLRVWPLVPTAVAVALVTLATGTVLAMSYADGDIDRAELSEIPLMPALVVAMVWHARTRAAAQRTLEALADARAASIERERDFFRDTSHAIKTPVTIARGHLELAEAGLRSSTPRDDIGTALRQLERLTILSNRLLMLAELDAGLKVFDDNAVAMRPFLLELGQAWSLSVPRRLRVECHGDALVRTDEESLALAVDALVENAVHFTADDGSIEISGRREGDHFLVRVADDGPGVPPEDLENVLTRFWHRRPPNGPMGSGLGLAMAAATARASGGTLRVGNDPSGGAVFELVLPAVPA